MSRAWRSDLSKDNPAISVRSRGRSTCSHLALGLLIERHSHWRNNSRSTAQGSGYFPDRWFLEDSHCFSRRTSIGTIAISRHLQFVENENPFASVLVIFDARSEGARFPDYVPSKLRLRGCAPLPRFRIPHCSGHRLSTPRDSARGDPREDLLLIMPHLSI